MRVIHKDGAAYTMASINVRDVKYSAQDDAFTVLFDWNYLPNKTGGKLQSDYVDMTNDGYGYYSGSVYPHGRYSGEPGVDITIR
ncbi:MAG: hypothetical protein ABIY70_06875 [Capsulimonas sp.]|uniref:hypothetical protein n=1 Tax=Capsulimonas sp. TaxID=2494211 RepID=UPI0032664DF1